MRAAVDGGKRKTPVQMHGSFGADYGVRTRYLHLGKVALYQMSYARRWCPEPESNQRHVDFQSTALPLSYSTVVWDCKGSEFF